MFINFISLYIIIFLYYYPKKLKGNINDIQYSDYLPKIKKSLVPNNNLKNICTRNSFNIMSKIEIPKEYLDFYKKVNPNEVYINIKNSYFGINKK